MSFKDHGYTLLRQVIPIECLEALKYELHHLVGAQGVLEDDLLHVDSLDHQKLYQAQITCGSSFAAYSLLVRSGLWRLAAEALGQDGLRLHVTPLHVQVQLPRVTTYDYAHHRESSFYPWAPNVLNCWFPVAASTGFNTGTISLIPGSHLIADRKVTTSNADTFIQLEPELLEGEEAKAIAIDADPGDLLLFHANTVHKSLPNTSNVPRVTGICRIINMGEIEARPLYKSLSYTQ